MSRARTTPDPTRPDLVPLRQWAEPNGVHERTARRMCDRGQIPGAIRDGSGWLVPASAAVPYTTPTHMRPARRTIPGEIVPAAAADVSPRWAPGEVAPAPARYTPEGPLFYTFDQLTALCPMIDPRTLKMMLTGGYFDGATRRGRADEHGHATWIVPAATIRRLQGLTP